MRVAQRTDMVDRWRWPFVLILATIVVVEIFMFGTNMGPEPWLVAVVVALVGVTIWCLSLLAATTHALVPTPRAVAAPRAPGADRRVKALRTGILFSRNMSGHSERLHETLVGVIDDQLMHAHGIDRASAPEAAAAVLGSKLAAFVRDADASASVADTKELARIVTLIEQI